MSEEDLPKLRALYENGVKNGVKELEIVDAKRLHELEPNVSKHAVAALWAPTGGIVCPFNLTIALAENAFDNGVEFQFNTEVTGFTWNDGYWTIHTNHGEFETRYVINAAGVYSDVLHNMVSTRKLHITPRRGDYCLLDKSTGDFVSHTIFQLPGKLAHMCGQSVLVFAGHDAGDKTVHAPRLGRGAGGCAHARGRIQNGAGLHIFRRIDHGETTPFIVICLQYSASHGNCQ